jgi:hypothetical protein
MVYEGRWTEGESRRLNELAAELVRLQVDAIVALNNRGSAAVKRATSSITIIAINVVTKGLLRAWRAALLTREPALNTVAVGENVV